MEIYTLVKYVQWEGGDNLAYFTHKPTVKDITYVLYKTGFGRDLSLSQVEQIVSNGIDLGDITLSIQKVEVEENE